MAIPAERAAVLRAAVEAEDEDQLWRLMSTDKQFVNEQGPNGVTPLLLAVEKEKLGMVQLLLRNGADRVLRYEDTRNTCMHIACSKGNQELVEALLKEKDGSFNPDGAFTTRVQNSAGKFAEQLISGTSWEAEAIRELIKEALPAANAARKARAQMTWDALHTQHQKSTSAALVGIL